MPKTFQTYIIFLITFTFLGCGSSDDDCTKTITIPQTYFVNNQSYTYNITQEVPCDTPEPEVPVIIEPPTLENFSYSVLYFTFTPDTGNNTNRLQFEIQLNNPNNETIIGVPLLTTSIDGLEGRGSFSTNAIVPCYEIAANSNCILTFDQEGSLDLGLIETIELIDVEYLLTN